MKLGAIMLFCASITLGLSPIVASASTLLVDPIIIDIDAAARDTITKDIKVINTTSQKLVVFATVNEVAVGSTGEIKEFITPVMTDRQNTVTSWLEITRGRIEIEPGASTTIPLTIRIHPQADAGDYYAFIGFVSASKRHEAEAAVRRGGVSGTVAKISIKEQKNTLLKLQSFLIDRLIFKDKDKIADFTFQNNGEEATTPTGEVVFYDSLGKEVGSTPINIEGVSLEPGETKVLSAVIPLEGGIGRFKANANVKYGDSQQASLFDTTQFFMVPFHYLIAALFVIIFLSIAITLLLHRVLHRARASMGEDGHELPLYVRNDREHNIKDHDINLKS
jgi:hypothetical protein